MTVKHRMGLRTFTRPDRSVRRCDFDVDRVAKQIEKFQEIVRINQDGGHDDHVLRSQIEVAIDSLTRQIGGREADIDEDLEVLRLM